jgi:hypothetical protein
VSGARALEAAHSSGAARRAADRTKRARRTTRRRGCATRMRVPVPHAQRRECVALRVTRRRGRAARYAFVFAYALTRTHSRGGVATRDGHTGWGWVGGWVGGGERTMSRPSTLTRFSADAPRSPVCAARAAIAALAARRSCREPPPRDEARACAFAPSAAARRAAIPSHARRRVRHGADARGAARTCRVEQSAHGGPRMGKDA